MEKMRIFRNSVTATTTGTMGFAAVIAASAGFGALSATPAAAQSLCSEYTVVRGDTLSRIASDAGVRGGFQRLFDANRNVMSNPNLLEVGVVLQIPCEDGSLPSGTAARATPAPAPVTTEVVAKPATFVTASGYAPFTDQDLPNGGMMTQMVSRAMEIGNPDQEYEISFVNDWSSHLSILLPSGAFDMTFPWFLPDCTKVDILSESNARRCTVFDASDPFYEAGVSYYTMNDSEYATATEYMDLEGATLCRPAGWFSFDLEGEGLVDPVIELVFARSEEDCWRMMQDGDVDVVTYDTLPAEDDSRSLGLTDQITELQPLASTVTLHVFTPKDNPNGRAYLDIVNAGLQELRSSGEWFEIVRSSIQTTVER